MLVTWSELSQALPKNEFSQANITHIISSSTIVCAKQMLKEGSRGGKCVILPNISGYPTVLFELIQLLNFCLVLSCWIKFAVVALGRTADEDHIYITAHKWLLVEMLFPQVHRASQSPPLSSSSNKLKNMLQIHTLGTSHLNKKAWGKDLLNCPCSCVFTNSPGDSDAHWRCDHALITRSQLLLGLLVLVY